jgi:hypothetical protein
MLARNSVYCCTVRLCAWFESIIYIYHDLVVLTRNSVYSRGFCSVLCLI